ncbi:MAG: hypothetical protein ACPG77_18250 [Nannocystaceae bacterium]
MSTLPAISVAAYLLGSAATPQGPHVDRACSGAAALTALTAAERDALLHTCTGKKVERADLRAAIFRLVSLAGPNSAGLARLLAPIRHRGPQTLHGETPSVIDWPQLQEHLRSGPGGLTSPACANLRTVVEEFEEAVAAGEVPIPPFIHDDPALTGCLGLDADTFSGTRLVTFRADNVEELFVAAATPSLNCLHRMLARYA